MIIKKIDDLTEEEKDASSSLRIDIKHLGIPYRIEVISSKIPLNKEPELVVMSTVAVWQSADKPNTLVCHELFTITIDQNQMKEAIYNISTNPYKYIKDNGEITNPN